MEGTFILKTIINRGGLIGICAKMYIHDKGLTDQFILECYSQCHIPEAEHFFGEELIIKIREYVSNLPCQEYSNLTYE